MSTTQTSNDAKKAGGYLKEKIAIGLSRVSKDEVVRAIMKVTSHKLKAPNEKHLVRLIAATHGNYNSGSTVYEDVNGFIVAELEQKTHTHNWIVVIKSLLVLHRFMSDGSNGIVKKIRQSRNIFCSQNIKDLADSVEGATQQRVILQYMRYLEERAIAQDSIGMQVRMEQDEYVEAMQEMNLQSQRGICNVLLQQAQCLTDVEYEDKITDNFATHLVFTNLINDGKRLYIILTNRIKCMLDCFESLPPSEKQEWLKLYKVYHKWSGEIARYFHQINCGARAFEIDVPELVPMPETVLHWLEEETLNATVPRESISSILGGPSNTAKTSLPSGNAPQQKMDAVFSQQQPPTVVKSPDRQPAKQQGLDLFATATTTITTVQPAVPPVKTASEAPLSRKDKGLSLSDMFDSTVSQPPPVATTSNTTTTQSLDLFANFGQPTSTSQQPNTVQQPPPVSNVQPVVQKPPGGFDPFDIAPPAPPPQPVTKKPDVTDFFSAPTAKTEPSGQSHLGIVYGPGCTNPAHSTNTDLFAPQEGRPKAW